MVAIGSRLYRTHRSKCKHQVVLTTNLTGSAGQNGITILAGGVTLDLSGFELTGVPGSVAGIFVGVPRANIAVRNGTVRNWEGDGMDMGNAANGQYRGLRLSENVGRGLRSGANSTVVRCTARGNSGGGIRGAEGCTIDGCTAWGNDWGIYAEEGSTSKD
jgi:hypothetical protein